MKDRKPLTEEELTFFREYTDPIWSQWLKWQATLVLAAGLGVGIDALPDSAISGFWETTGLLFFASFVNYTWHYQCVKNVITAHYPDSKKQ